MIAVGRPYELQTDCLRPFFVVLRIIEEPLNGVSRYCGVSCYSFSYDGDTRITETIRSDNGGLIFYKNLGIFRVPVRVREVRHHETSTSLVVP